MGDTTCHGNGWVFRDLFRENGCVFLEMGAFFLEMGANFLEMGAFFVEMGAFSYKWVSFCVNVILEMGTLIKSSLLTSVSLLYHYPLGLG